MPEDLDLAPLSAAQLEVVRAIWQHGEASITQVWETLKAKKPIARATVQTTIQRLETKGWLSHREVGQTFLFSVVCSQERAERRFVTDLLESAFDGSASGLVKALLHQRKLSKDEADSIRDVIARAERRRRSRSES